MKECPSSSCAPANSERRQGTRDKQRALAIQCVWQETAKDASPVLPGCAAYSHQEQEIKTFPAYPPEQPPGSLLVLDLDSRTFQRVVLWSEKQQLTRGNRRATTLTMNAHLQQTKKLEATGRGLHVAQGAASRHIPAPWLSKFLLCLKESHRLVTLSLDTDFQPQNWKQYLSCSEKLTWD